MIKKRTIIFIVFDGGELLDIAGPSAVFASANDLAGAELYDLGFVSREGGMVVPSCGLPLGTQPINSVCVTKNDSVFVPGAQREALLAAMEDETIGAFLKQAANTAERYGSICSGTFILAANGLLDGRKAATHWAGERLLAEDYGSINVNRDALYVRDGNIWTSAGVTTGIDMALAIVEADHGLQLKLDIAKQLVVYAHRPGHQSQFGDVLRAQMRSGHEFKMLISWLQGRMDQPTKTAEMAEFVGQSERTFQRRFKDCFGEAPAKYFEHLRLDHAKFLLEAGALIKYAASAAGYRSEAAFRAAFKARFGVAPGLHVTRSVAGKADMLV